jgi:hypothetical protein
MALLTKRCQIPITASLSGPLGNGYDAEVHYWIYLYVDGDGRLQGYVNWYNCWVSGGNDTGYILGNLQDEIGSGLGPVNDLISQALAPLNAASKWKYLYYLPGFGTQTGNTDDGVTVVFGSAVDSVVNF